MTQPKRPEMPAMPGMKRPHVDRLNPADFATGPVPDSISPVQARLALNRLDWRIKAEHYAKTPRDVADLWEFSTALQRKSPLTAAWEAAGIDVDTLFRVAATL